MTPGAAFWLRWSARDLRRRWLVVAAIAGVIAIGTGLATGLGSMETWRVGSNDASFAALRMHDFRIALAEGSYARAGELAEAIRSIPHARWIAAADERLKLQTQIEATAGGKRVFVPATLYGVPLGRGVAVDRIGVHSGRPLKSGKRAQAMLQTTFGRATGLGPGSTISLPGGHRLQVAGLAYEPEQFIVIPPAGLYSGAGGYGVAYTSLATAQSLAKRPGGVNELVLRVREPARAAVVGRELERAVRRQPRLARLGASVTARADEASYRILYRDARNDQKIFDTLSLLVLLAAGFAAFNLINRVVEAQRREIGIGMALGVPGGRLALRPALLGAEIAALGVLLGLGAGLVVARLMEGVLTEIVPLPEMRTGIPASIFLRGAALGLAIPLLATLYPVWRGSRLSPVEAMNTGPCSGRRPGLARLFRRLALPGSTIAQMPLRSLLRTPRRTLATLLAVAAVVTVVVAFAGMLDSFHRTVERQRTDLLSTAPARIDIGLVGFLPANGLEVARLERSPVVRSATSGVTLTGKLVAGGVDFDVLVSLVRLRNVVWRPHVASGRLPSRAGEILIAPKAARDLDAGIGSGVVLEHPQRVGSTFRVVRERFVVSGLSANPMRTTVYLGYERSAARFGLAGAANVVTVDPRPGVAQADAERALFGRPGVASIQPVAFAVDELDRSIGQFRGILRVAEGGALLLTLLIAFNAVSIGIEERRRDFATMFAYGLPGRSVLRLGMLENALLGTAGTAAGIGGGMLALTWIVGSLFPETYPEMGVVRGVDPASLLTAALVGVVAMAAAPLLLARRLRRMDIPSTLRVVE